MAPPVGHQEDVQKYIQKQLNYSENLNDLKQRLGFSLDLGDMSGELSFSTTLTLTCSSVFLAARGGWCRQQYAEKATAEPGLPAALYCCQAEPSA